MGGYGLFVWGSYGMTVAVILIEVWQLKVRRRGAVSDLQRESARGRSI
jgi:heme exporter protein D